MTKVRDVFISYRHREPTRTWVTENLEPALSAAGFTTVLDSNDFVPGETVLGEIEGSAARARLTIAVVDDAYDDSWYTRYEAALSGQLLVIQRSGVAPVPAAVRVLPPENSDDLEKIVEAVHSLVHRALVLESEADREFVAGFLLPALRKANIDAIDIADVSELVGDNTPPGEALDRAIEWADRVIVVVSRTYLHDLGRDEGLHLQHWEHSKKRKKAIPLILDAPDDTFAVPPTYDPVLWVDMHEEELWYESLQRICDAFGVTAPDPDKPPACPYPGMRPYQYLPPQPGHAFDQFPFFGRDPEIADILDQLGRRRTAAVIGPSGSGKSSLVLAGVLPAVHEGALEGRQLPQVEVIRPADPTHDREAAVERLSAARAAGRIRVLVVDQLEQAFLNATPPDGLPPDDPALLAADGATRLLDRIVEIRDDDPELYLIVTMRADFQHELMVSAIWPLLILDIVYITPLSGTHLEAAITGPAARRGVEISGALVVRLADEMRGQPGLLPFLQESLRRLWGRMPWWYLSLSAEQWNTGEFGVRKAIRTHADDVRKQVEYQWPDDGTRIMRAILLRLVHFGLDERSTRQQVPVERLARAWPADRPRFDAVLSFLGEQRIVTIDERTSARNSDDAHTVVADLSHDALITGWPTLHQWIDENRDLETRRRSWLDRVGGEPLSGVDLAEAVRWLKQAQGADLSLEVELVEYIAMSRDHEEAERRAAERQRARERTMFGVVSGLAVVMFVLAAAALWQWNSARAARERAEAEADRRVATELQTSAAAYEGGLPLQSLLVRAADVIDETELGAIEMLVTAERDPGMVSRIDATTRNVGFEAAALLADGRVAIGDGRGGVAVWQPGDVEPQASTDVGHGVLTIAALDDSPTIAVGGGNVVTRATGFEGSDGWVDLIDTSRTPLTPHRVRLDSESPVSTAIFDGDELLVGSWDGSVSVIDMSNPSNPAIAATLEVPALPTDVDCDIEDADRKVRSLAIDDAGRWLVAATNHCLVVVWDRTTLSDATVLTGHTSKVRSAAFVPGTAELLTTGDDATIRSWDLEAPTPTSDVLVPAADEATGDEALESRIVAMCIAPDGKTVVTGGRDHLVRTWQREEGALTSVTEFPSHASTVRGVACPTSTRFMSVAGDGVVQWDVARPSRWGDRVATDAIDGRTIVVAARPNGAEQLAGSADGAVMIIDSDGARRRIEAPTNTDGFDNVAWSADGSSVVAIAHGADGWPDGLMVYDSNDLEVVRSYEAEGLGRLWSVAADDDQMVVAGMNEREILVLVGGETQILDSPSGRPATAVAVLPSGHLVVGDDAGSLTCLSPTGTPEPRSIQLGRRVNDLAVAPTGALAVATSDGQILVFSTAADGSTEPCDPLTWPSASPPVVHDSVESVDLSDSGELLVAATSSGWAELWDIPRMRLVGQLTMPDRAVASSVSISSNAESILLGGDSTAIQLRVDREGLRTRLCELAARNLTPDEEASFLPADRYREAARCFADPAG